MKEYDGVGHVFAENRQEASADALDWLDRIGLGARARVDVEFVDAVSQAGHRFSGVQYTPATGEDRSKPVFLLLHGWSGDTLWSSNHWLGVRLAQQGYTAIAMRVGVSGRRGVTAKPLETITDDIAVWTQYVADQGYDRIIGEGHSAGGIWWTTYLAQTQDLRVQGVIYLAPTNNFSEVSQANLGDAYAPLVAYAKDAVAKGRGKETMISADLLPEDKKRQFPFFQYADAYLSYWGPDAKSVHTEEIKKVKVPILSIVGSKDGLVPKSFLARFDAAAGDKAESRYYADGAPHSLKGWEDRVAADVVEWTRRRFERQ